MKRETFREHFERAAARAFELARSMVRNHLPPLHDYSVHLNQSHDDHPLRPGECVFPDDVARLGEIVGPLDADAVVNLLWRDGLIPEWIDISVEDADSELTHFTLLTCGRFTDRAEHLYYSDTDVCPFGIKSPVLPPYWQKSNGPFELPWRGRPDR